MMMVDFEVNDESAHLALLKIARLPHKAENKSSSQEALRNCIMSVRVETSLHSLSF